MVWFDRKAVKPNHIFVMILSAMALKIILFFFCGLGEFDINATC